MFEAFPGVAKMYLFFVYDKVVILMLCKKPKECMGLHG